MNNVLTIAAIVLLVLLFMKVPVYISIFGGAATYFLLNPNINAIMFAQRAIVGAQNISLLPVPFFVCAGVFMNYTGVTRRIMDFCAVVTGRMVGGLAQVNVLLSTLMGGLSGSNLADAAMEAKMLVPEMEAKGFSKEFSTVVTAASSMITPLIPPGITMIVYGVIGNVSIGKLFISGIGVGTLLCVSMMVMVRTISKKRGYLPMRTEPITRKEFIAATKPAILPLLLPFVIIGGIRIGVFTATEAGAIAIAYAVVLGIVYREMRLQDLVKGIKETVSMTASIMLIVAAACVFSWVLTNERIPQKLTAYIMQVISNKYVFLFIINVFLLFVGMFIEGNASMIIMVPLLAPIAAGYGINEIQFAMMYIFNNAIGAMTPPMGTLIFVTCSVTKCKTGAFIKECIPFYVMLFIDLMLLTYVPFFTTFLVDLFY